jgi:hypothetical protein
MSEHRELEIEGTNTFEQRCAECEELFPTADAVAEHAAVSHRAVSGVEETEALPPATISK